MSEMMLTYHVVDDNPSPEIFYLGIIETAPQEYDVESGSLKTLEYTQFIAHSRDEALKPFVDWVYEQEELGNLYEVVVKTEE